MRLRIIALPILFITSLVILTVLYRQEINTLFGSNIAANVLIVVWIVADVVSPFFIKATTGPRLGVLDTERNATVELKTKKGISRIHLATIPVVNRQSIFGDTARDAEAGIGYPVILPPVDENDFSYVSLPWLDARGILPSLQISRNIQMKNPSDVIAALVESGYLKYDKISIERGVARGAVVLLGLESTGAIYIANRTPIELPKPTENQMPSLPFWFSLR